MRVCVVRGPSDVRAVNALGVRLAASGHEVVLAGESSPGVYGIEAIAAVAGGSDVVVGLGSAGPWAASAAERVGAAAVLAEIEPTLPTREFPPPLKVRPPKKLTRPVSSVVDAMGWVRDGRAVNDARHASGLGRMGNPWHELPVLGAWSSTLVPTPADWDAGRVSVTGEWWLADDPVWEPDAELKAFLAVGDRPIYVGFAGATGSLAEYALEAILEAWGDTYRILLDAADLGAGRELPENVCRIGSAPAADWLFTRCGALVLECGAARAHAAARSGIPTIPVPFTPSQRFWGDRLYEAGIATRPVDPRSGWEAYKAALRATVALRDPAKEIAQRITAEDGLTVAVTSLESLVRATHL
jgi:sterol 3beta-glucosyltransferase